MMIRKGYKKTGVLTVDKVAACIYHYEQHGQPLSKIYLDEQHWAIFSNVANQMAAGCIDNNTIDFDGVLICKGSKLMTKDMYWEFKVKAEA